MWLCRASVLFLESLIPKSPCYSFRHEFFANSSVGLGVEFSAAFLCLSDHVEVPGILCRLKMCAPGHATAPDFGNFRGTSHVDERPSCRCSQYNGPNKIRWFSDVHLLCLIFALELDTTLIMVYPRHTQWPNIYHGEEELLGVPEPAGPKTLSVLNPDSTERPDLEDGHLETGFVTTPSVKHTLLKI